MRGRARMTKWIVNSPSKKIKTPVEEPDFFVPRKKAVFSTPTTQIRQLVRAGLLLLYEA